jgi:hypothetical protein
MDHAPEGATMTRSIFDPTGLDTERSGSRNLGPDAANISHMPPDVIDGEVSDEEVQDVEGAAISAQESMFGPDDAVTRGEENHLNPGRGAS